MKIAFLLVFLGLADFEARAQMLPSGQSRALLVHAEGLKEARIKSEQELPQWLAKCDPPFYEVFSLRVTPVARVLMAVFIGGNAREEAVTYTLIPETVRSCTALGGLDSYTFRRASPMPKGEYSETFPVLNARNEIIYLLHEEKSRSSPQGSASVTRTLLALSDKSLKQIGRLTKTDIDAAQPADAAIPFASLLK